MRKRKFAGGIVALCLVLSVAGCGKTSEEKQAANYYQKELGLDKDEAEELAHEIYGKDKDEEKPSATEAPEEPKEIVVEPLPELLNSEWWEGTEQVLDMVFPGDGTLTEEDIRKIVAGSAYDDVVEIVTSFDADGNLRIASLFLGGFPDGDFLISFNKSGDYYVPNHNNYPPKNCYSKEFTEFADFKTRDDVLAWLAENNFTEVEESQATYAEGFYRSSVIYDEKLVEFADTPHYFCHGVQSIEIYRMHKLNETDQEIKEGYRTYSGSHTNLVNFVKFVFNTDGTINTMDLTTRGGMIWVEKEFIIMGARID